VIKPFTLLIIKQSKKRSPLGGWSREWVHGVHEWRFLHSTNAAILDCFYG